MHLACHSCLSSQKALADHLNVTPATITGAIKKLEQDGYVERTLGQDNRYNELRITEKGRDIVNESCKIFSEVDAAMFDGFSDEELDCYISCLERLQANIKNQCERKKD